MQWDFTFDTGQLNPSSEPSHVAEYVRTHWAELINDEHEQADTARRLTSAVRRDALEALEMLARVSSDALTWATEQIAASLEDDDDNEADMEYFSVTTGLAGRATEAFEDIICLLQLGRISGAHARLRSLQEIFIVNTVIAVHGQPNGDHPGLPRAYTNHHRVFARSLAEELLATGDLDPHILDDETLTKLENIRAELIAQYGPAYKTLWGWAVELFPSKTQITLSRLAKLIDERLSALNSIASRYVHASSEGWLDYQDDKPNDLGSFDYVAVLASGLLLLTLQSVIPLRVEKDGEIDTEGEAWLDSMIRLQAKLNPRDSAPDR